MGQIGINVRSKTMTELKNMTELKKEITTFRFETGVEIGAVRKGQQAIEDSIHDRLKSLSKGVLQNYRDSVDKGQIDPRKVAILTGSISFVETEEDINLLGLYSDEEFQFFKGISGNLDYSVTPPVTVARDSSLELSPPDDQFNHRELAKHLQSTIKEG